MDPFDKILGYEVVKKELLRLADALRCQLPYKLIGVPAPRGLILHGDPGVGKTLMAKCLIEASGRKACVCRRDRNSSDFLQMIVQVFDSAMEDEPSVILLDDLDKFAESEEGCGNEEEFVTVQACIDKLGDADVFVIGTVNDLDRLPDSLKRPGRFDKIIHVEQPTGEDAVNITRHYLSTKPVTEDVDPNLITKIIEGGSCAALEAAVNAAGRLAGFERCGNISMRHMLAGCIETVFQVPYDLIAPHSGRNPGDVSHEFSRAACHEAGHALVAEVLKPGSVALTCIHECWNSSYGFTSCADMRDFRVETLLNTIMISLAGGAATEHRFGIVDDGTFEDYRKARRILRDMITQYAAMGFSLLESPYRDSEDLLANQDRCAGLELERLYACAKRIIIENEEFHLKLSCALLDRGCLTAKELQEIKETCRIVPPDMDEIHISRQALFSVQSSCRMAAG